MGRWVDKSIVNPQNNPQLLSYHVDIVHNPQLIRSGYCLNINIVQSQSNSPFNSHLDIMLILVNP
jgi:hypothetical protein